MSLSGPPPPLPLVHQPPPIRRRRRKLSVAHSVQSKVKHYKHNYVNFHVFSNSVYRECNKCGAIVLDLRAHIKKKHDIKGEELDVAVRGGTRKEDNSDSTSRKATGSSRSFKRMTEVIDSDLETWIK